jgi:hypothetical protein
LEEREEPITLGQNFPLFACSRELHQGRRNRFARGIANAPEDARTILLGNQGQHGQDKEKGRLACNHNENNVSLST